MSQTMPRMDVATAMLVCLDDRISGMCVTLLDDAGFRVIRVKHVHAALERVPHAMPILVLIPTALRKEDEDQLADRCLAVGAEMIRLGADVDARAVAALIAGAAQAALSRGQ